MGGKFKFKVQDSDLEYFFLRFDKHIALSEKNIPLPSMIFELFNSMERSFQQLKVHIMTLFHESTKKCTYLPVNLRFHQRAEMKIDNLRNLLLGPEQRVLEGRRLGLWEGPSPRLKIKKYNIIKFNLIIFHYRNFHFELAKFLPRCMIWPSRWRISSRQLSKWCKRLS